MLFLAGLILGVAVVITVVLIGLNKICHAFMNGILEVFKWR